MIDHPFALNHVTNGRCVCRVKIRTGKDYKTRQSEILKQFFSSYCCLFVPFFLNPKTPAILFFFCRGDTEWYATRFIFQLKEEGKEATWQPCVCVRIGWTRSELTWRKRREDDRSGGRHSLSFAFIPPILSAIHIGRGYARRKEIASSSSSFSFFMIFVKGEGKWNVSMDQRCLVCERKRAGPIGWHWPASRNSSRVTSVFFSGFVPVSRSLPRCYRNVHRVVPVTLFSCIVYSAARSPLLPFLFLLFPSHSHSTSVLLRSNRQRLTTTEKKKLFFSFSVFFFLPFLFAYLREVNRAWKLPTYTQHSRVETHVPVSSLSLSEVLCGRWNFCLFEMCDSPDRRGERRRFLSTFFFFPPVIFDMAKRTTDIPPLGVCVWKHFHDAHTHTQDFWCAKEYIVVRQLFLSLGYTLVRAQSGPPEIFSCYWTAVAGWCGCVFVANGTRWSMMMVKGDIALVVTKTRHANIIDGRREGGSRNCCPNISLSGRPSAPA